MNEEWRSVKRNPNYEISNQGRLRNHKGLILKPMKGKRNYWLSMNGTCTNVCITTLLNENWRYEWIKQLEDDEEAKPLRKQPGFFITNKARVWNTKSLSWVAVTEAKSGHHLLGLNNKTYDLSRLVGRYFLPDFVEDLWVLHRKEELPYPERHQPDNLWMGTQPDNMKDRDVKERTHSKLSHQDVRDIRQLSETLTQTKIGEMYGVTQVCVSDIIRGRTFSYV